MKLIDLGEGAVPLDGIVGIEKINRKVIFGRRVYLIDLYYADGEPFSDGFTLEYGDRAERDKRYTELVKAASTE